MFLFKFFFEHDKACQTGNLLKVNSCLTNLGTYSQKHTNRKRKHNVLRQRQYTK